MSNKAIELLDQSTNLIRHGQFTPDRETALAAIAAARNALDAAHTFPEIQKITNQLEVFKIYYQKSKADFEATKALALAWLHGCARMGIWLQENINHNGGRPQKNSRTHATVLPQGIEKDQSSRLQRIADLDADLDAWVAELNDAPSFAAALRWWLELYGLKQAETPPLPDGIFDLIYADPPWAYSNSGFEQSANQHYSTMPVTDICQLKDSKGRAINDIAADNSVLFLWVTSPILPNGLAVMEAWGFQYKESMVWKKDRAPGIRFWLNTKHEYMLIGSRGSFLPEITPDARTAPPAGIATARNGGPGRTARECARYAIPRRGVC